MRKSTIFNILIIIISIVLLFSACDNSSENITNERKMAFSPNDNQEILSRLEVSKMSDSGYGFFADELSADLNSTYYSQRFLSNIGYMYNEAKYQEFNYDNSALTFWDIYLYTMLFSDDLNEDNRQRQKVIENIMKYKVESSYFVMSPDYNSDDPYSDDTVLFGTCYSIKILKALNTDFEYDSLLPWFDKYITSLTRNTKITLETFEELYLLYQIAVDLNHNISYIQEYIESNFTNYESEIMEAADQENYIFYLNTYLNIIQEFQFKSIMTKDDVSRIINIFKNSEGGFSLNKAEQPNPLPTYIISQLCKVLDYKYDFSDYKSFVLRHQRSNGFFIPYIILESDLESTYYVYSILQIANEQNIEDLSAYLKQHNDQEEQPFYLYLQQLYGKNINVNMIKQIINDKLSSDIDITKKNLNDIKILIDLCKLNGITVDKNNVDKFCSSIKENVKSIYNEENDKKREAAFPELLLSLSVYLSIDYDNSYINNVIKDILSKVKIDNLYTAYYYYLLLDSVENCGILNKINLDATLDDQIASVLRECYSETGFYSIDTTESSVTMISNYFGVKLNDYLDVSR